MKANFLFVCWKKSKWALPDIVVLRYSFHLNFTSQHKNPKKSQHKILKHKNPKLKPKSAKVFIQIGTVTHKNISNKQSVKDKFLIWLCHCVTLSSLLYWFYTETSAFLTQWKAMNTIIFKTLLMDTHRHIQKLKTFAKKLKELSSVFTPFHFPFTDIFLLMFLTWLTVL